MSSFSTSSNAHCSKSRQQITAADHSSKWASSTKQQFSLQQGVTLGSSSSSPTSKKRPGCIARFVTGAAKYDFEQQKKYSRDGQLYWAAATA
ncbi:hypothetical protein ACLOJK_029280, partial [Asimina triloba]